MSSPVLEPVFKPQATLSKLQPVPIAEPKSKTPTSALSWLLAPAEKKAEAAAEAKADKEAFFKEKEKAAAAAKVEKEAAAFVKEKA